MINAIDLAKYIVSKCSRDECPISNLQLQKILFFIQKNRLVQNGWSIKDDFEAWQYGPVIRSVYNFFSIYAGIKIDEVFRYNLPDYVMEDVNDTVEKLRKMDPWELVTATHEKGGAWDTVYQNGLGYKKIISKKLIANKG